MEINKVIFITGYQHSGTSVLKRIIGAHPDVFEVPSECWPNDIKLHKFGGYDICVCKIPLIWWSKEFKKNIEADGLTRINIIKNPLDVFSSLKLRYKSYSLQSSKYEDVKQWEKWADYFLDHTPKTDFNLRYEDLFIGNGPNNKMIKGIISACGLSPCPNILELKQQENIPIKCQSTPASKPERWDHEAFRSWQINQPLRNHSNENRHVLSKKDMEYITNLEGFQRLYGGDET